MGWALKEVRHGYGFVNEATPEVSIGVQGLWRRLGIGTRLLMALRAEARASAIPRLSLSVEHDNPAFRLYERLGYAALTGARGAATKRLGVSWSRYGGRSVRGEAAVGVSELRRRNAVRRGRGRRPG